MEETVTMKLEKYNDLIDQHYADTTAIEKMNVEIKNLNDEILKHEDYRFYILKKIALLISEKESYHLNNNYEEDYYHRNHLEKVIKEYTEREIDLVTIFNYFREIAQEKENNND